MRELGQLRPSAHRHELTRGPASLRRLATSDLDIVRMFVHLASRAAGAQDPGVAPRTFTMRVTVPRVTSLIHALRSIFQSDMQPSRPEGM